MVEREREVEAERELTADFIKWSRFVGIAGVEIGNGFGSVL